jgi:hypothetical protein
MVFRREQYSSEINAGNKNLDDPVRCVNSRCIAVRKLAGMAAVGSNHPLLRGNSSYHGDTHCR